MLTRATLMTVTLVAALSSSAPVAAGDSCLSSPPPGRAYMSSYHRPARPPQPRPNPQEALAIVLVGSSLLVGAFFCLALRLQPAPGKQRSRKRRTPGNPRHWDHPLAHNSRTSRHNGRVSPTNWK